MDAGPRAIEVVGATIQVTFLFTDIEASTRR
jgi:class 3 adenylate cyclase